MINCQWMQVKPVNLKQLQPEFQNLLRISLLMKAISNNRTEIQIRFALTGRLHTCQYTNSIDQIKQIIYNEYKIDLDDQILITKMGKVLNSKEKFDSSGKLKNSFSSNLPGSQHMDAKPCIYLFNVRQLTRECEDLETDDGLSRECEEIWKKNFIGLCQNIFELKSLQENLEPENLAKVEKRFPCIQALSDTLHLLLLDFRNLYEEYKVIEYSVEDYGNRCENQRKAQFTLLKHVITQNEDKISMFETLKSKVNSLQQRQKPDQEEQSSSLYSAELEIRNITAEIEQAIRSGRSKIADFKSKIKNEKKKIHSEMISIDNTRRNDHNYISSVFKEMKEPHLYLIEIINQWLELGQESEVERGITKFLEGKDCIQLKCRQNIKKIEASKQEMKNLFNTLFRTYRSNEKIVRQNYHIFSQLAAADSRIVAKFQQVNKKIMQLHNSYEIFESSSVSAFSKNKEVENIPVNVVQSKTHQLHEREQGQLKRRTIFNVKLEHIQEQLRQIIRQEEKERRMFVAEAIQEQELYDHKVLSNVKVPAVLLNYDETSDRDIQSKSSKKSSMFREIYNIDTDIFKPIAGIEKIIQELEIIKSCHVNLKRDEGAAAKLRNLKTILEKSSKVFYRIYQHKLHQETKKYERDARALNINLKSLEESVLDYKCKIGELTKKDKSSREEKKWLQQQLGTLKTELSKLTTENSGLRERLQSSNIDTKLKGLQNQLHESSRRESYLKKQNSKLSDQLNSQLSMLEPLVLEFESAKLKLQELTDLNEQYKTLTNDQETKINILELELQQVRQTRMPAESPQRGQLDTGPGLRVEAEMKEKILRLEGQVELLRTENDHINEQLMKIMIKDVEDQQIQVQMPEQVPEKTIPVSSNIDLSRISFEPVIKQGDRRLFIPFSNGIYVAAQSDKDCQPNQTKYITHLHSINMPTNEPYLLDLNCLSGKARQLLTECSFVVVAKVNNIMPADSKSFVEVSIEYLMGFEDDDMTVHDYANLIN